MFITNALQTQMKYLQRKLKLDVLRKCCRSSKFKFFFSYSETKNKGKLRFLFSCFKPLSDNLHEAKQRQENERKRGVCGVFEKALV